MSSALKTVFALPLRGLTWLGGQGTRAVAAVVFIAAAVPPLGALLRPYVTEAILVLLCISFMRVDLAALYGHLRRPALVATATAWTTIGVPLIVGLIAHATGLTERAPGLALALMLQSMASPMMASPALAALMGLDATLVLVTLVTATAIVPFTASLFASLFLGGMLSISPLTLGLKLLGILAASLLAATAIRWSFRRRGDPAPQAADRRLQHHHPPDLRGRDHGRCRERSGGAAGLHDQPRSSRPSRSISRCSPSRPCCSAASATSARWRSG